MQESHLDRRPEAKTESVEDLVARVLRGRVRVPTFQRGLKWDRSDVRDLFDSLYRGYPIGSLLFYVGQAEAERLRVGPVEVDAEETPEAWWVVDGQQRVTALAASLGRPLPLPDKPEPEDKFVLYFDAERREFESPPQTGRPKTSWVPLPVLLDASRLTEWVFQWPHGDDADMRRVVFEAGRRLREYVIPLYLIEATDPKIAREIFHRTNKSGKPLTWGEVHKALYGGQQSSPATLPELDEHLLEVGMGPLESHCLAGENQELLASSPEQFLDSRKKRLVEEVRRFATRMAAWEHNDRPSIDHLLEEAGVEL